MLDEPIHGADGSRGNVGRRQPERGQILAIVAGGFIGILALAALVLEGGNLFLNRRDGQNAADLAAVAGARVVALHYTDGGRTEADVYADVESVLNVNGCGAGGGVPCDWSATLVGDALAPIKALANSAVSLPAGTLGVQVDVTRHPGAILGQAVGFSSWDVSTVGAAVSARPSQFPAGTMLPIALCGYFNSTDPDECGQAMSAPANFIDFQPGQIYDLVEGKDAPGGFGWLSWTGSNSSTSLEGSVCTPDNPGFSLDSPYDDPGDPSSTPGQSANFAVDHEVWFPLGPGKMNSSGMRTCLDHWIDTGATVLVPIYDIVIKDPPLQPTYHITGVAAFVLIAREQPAVDQIQGRFVEYYPFSDIPSGSGWTPPSPGDVTVFTGLVK